MSVSLTLAQAQHGMNQETRIGKRLHCLPEGIGDWIFQASAEDLAACCSREKLKVGGRIDDKLQRLVDAWSPPPQGVCTVRKGRASVSSAANHWDIARIQQLQQRVAELQQEVEERGVLTVEDDVAVDAFPITALGVAWTPLAEFEEFAHQVRKDAVTEVPMWTRAECRADVVTLFDAEDRLRQGGVAEQDRHLWLALMHIAPRRKLIAAFAEAVLQEHQGAFTALRAREIVTALEHKYAAKETRFDTTRPTGGIGPLRALVDSDVGLTALEQHVANVLALPASERRPANIDRLLLQDKTIPTLHKGCKYMRGHHCRQSHLHFARTCDSDYDADD